MTRRVVARRSVPCDLRVLEADYQSTVMQAMERLGWHVWHVRRATWNGKKWTTPTTSAGVPDLHAVRGGWIVVAECKTDKKYPTSAQREWLNRYALVPYVLTWVLRPKDDWDQFCAWLQHPETAPKIFGWKAEP